MGHDATSMYLPHRKQKGHGSLVQGVRATKIEKKKLHMADSHLKNDEFLPDSTAFYTLWPLVFFEKSK